MLSANVPTPSQVCLNLKLIVPWRHIFFLGICSPRDPQSPTLKVPEVLESSDSTVSPLLQICRFLWDQGRQFCNLVIIISSIVCLLPRPHLHVLTILAILLKILQWLLLNPEQNLSINGRTTCLLCPYLVSLLVHQALDRLSVLQSLKYTHFISLWSHCADFLLLITGQMLLFL